MSHGQRKRRKRHGKRTAKAVQRRHPVVSAPSAASLLGAVADALNACESAGISVKLAHGAVITESGYVFGVGPDDAPWAVRTRMLTPFPVADVDD